MERVKIFNDSFQNYKVYGLPKAQLILTDVPYCLGKNAYASNPVWYVDGDNTNGESDKAGKQFFSSDSEFRPAEFMHFCSKMLIKEPKQTGKSPCMIMFCEWAQQFQFVELGRKYGLNHYIPLVFRKKWSAQVLKANMRVVGNCEYGLILYRDKLPKFNNGGGDGVQLLRVDKRHEHAKDTSYPKTSSVIRTPNRNLHRRGRCSNRSLCRQRNNSVGGIKYQTQGVWI